MTRSLGRFRCSDTVSAWRDQEELDPGAGALLARLVEERNGAWSGQDGKGRRLRVTRAKDGALEIRHLVEPGDAADPDIVGTHPGAGGMVIDPARAAAGDALARWHRSARYEDHGRALRDYQAALDRHYAGK